ncbi:MAG: hypothetical protein IKV36_03600 [Clostridia bacterium]|nr:hypothetical protein [Clostridia bacterium]
MKTINEVITQYNQRISSLVGTVTKVFTEFPGERMQYPLKDIQISTGVHNLKVYLVEDKNEVLQPVKELTVQATICAPKTTKGERMLSILECVINAALADDMPQITEIHTSNAEYDSSIGGITQSVFITTIV